MLVHFFSQRLSLLFRHVFEGTLASRIESLCVGILSFCTQIFANIPDFFEKNNFFLPRSFCVTGRIPLDVGHSHFYEDILPNFGFHSILLFLSLLQIQVALVVHVEMLAGSYFDICHLSLAHLEEGKTQEIMVVGIIHDEFIGHFPCLT